MTPGDLVLVDLDPAARNEQAGFRPAVVISCTDHHELVAGRLLVVCPVTDQGRDLPHHVQITRSHGHRLNRPSWVMCEQPRTISSRRVVRRLGSLLPADLDQVATVVHRLLHRP